MLPKFKTVEGQDLGDRFFSMCRRDWHATLGGGARNFFLEDNVDSFFQMGGIWVGYVCGFFL